MKSGDKEMHVMPERKTETTRERNVHNLTEGWHEEHVVPAFPGVSDVSVEDPCQPDEPDYSFTLSNEGFTNTPCPQTSPEDEKDFHRHNADERAENLVQTYFRSLGNISLLSRDEEAGLARRIEEGTALVDRIISTMPLFPKDEELAGGCKRRISEHPKTKDGESRRNLRMLDELIAQKGWEEAASLLGLGPEEFGAKMDVIGKARGLVDSAKNELIGRNLRLSINVAKHYVGRGLPLLDLIQEGNIGLMHAIDKFDYRKGFKFSTCATWWIRQSITKALLDQAKTIRVPANIMELYKQVSRASVELSSEFGREPGTDEIAARLGLDRKRVEDALTAIQDPIALQTAVGDGGATIEDFISDNTKPSQFSDLDQDRITQQILNVLHTLTEREATVIRMRYGIGMDRTFTLSEIGRQLAVSCERVRQIEATTMKKLKQPKRIKELETLVAS